jgi:hypothetical protein
VTMQRFVDVTSVAVGRLNLDLLSRFPLTNYILVGAGYTVLVFWVSFTNGGPRIFSKQNAKPLSAILRTHLVFLVVLMEFLRIASGNLRFLPNWWTDRTIALSRVRQSPLEFMFIIVMGIMYFIERRSIYTESATETSDSGN